MEHEFVNLSLENIDNIHLCCFIKSKQQHLGVLKKKEWLKERIKEGHVYRRLIDDDKMAFIEYAPLEKAWVPIEGDDYLYIYCLSSIGDTRGNSIKKELLEYAINDAKKANKAGICVLSHNKKKTWLNDGEFFLKHGFKVVDNTPDGYQLLTLSLKQNKPHFSLKAKKGMISDKNLVIYYSYQCPFIFRSIEIIKEYCEKYSIPLSLKKIDTLAKAKRVPSIFNNYAVFYKGNFVTINLLDIVYLERNIHQENKK